MRALLFRSNEPLVDRASDHAIPPHTIELELAKDIADARQIAPGAAGPQQKQNEAHRRPHVGLAQSPAG